MSNATHYDIAIIGAGAAGLSAAYFLSKQARVLVLEREPQPAYHSSGRSAAMYIQGYESPVVAELTLQGREFFQQPPDGFTEHNLLSPSGGLTVAGPGELARLETYIETWRSVCPDLVSLSPQETQEIVPILRSEWVTAAAYDPSWQNIDVHELLSGFQRGIKSCGSDLISDAEVLSLSYDVQQWSLATHQEIYTADIVINAAGAWANHVGALAGLEALPLTPMRRTAAIVPAPADSQDWPLLHTISEDLYFKPESPGLMICPQDETPVEAMDAYPLDLDVAIGIDRFQHVTTYSVEHVLHSWAGLRTFASDRLPVIGIDQLAPGFFWLAGQGGFGIQTAPGIGQHVADILFNQKSVIPRIDINRYR